MVYKNQIRTTLTAKGERILKQAMKLDGITNVISRLSAAQQKELKNMLTGLKETSMKEMHLSPKALPLP